VGIQGQLCFSASYKVFWARAATRRLGGLPSGLGTQATEGKFHSSP